MGQIDDVLGVLRDMKKRNDGPLSLQKIFKSLIDEGICDSSKSVSECLKKLSISGKIKTLNAGVNIELLEEVKVNYVQSSLLSLDK